MKLAIFDFDGTIYKKETFTVLMNHLKQCYPKLFKKFYLTIMPIYLGYKMKMIKEATMKKTLMYHYTRAFDDFTEKQTTDFFKEVFQEMHCDFNEQVTNRIEQHHTAGFTNIIISGAFTHLLQQTQQMYSIDYIIGTHFTNNKNHFDHVQAERKVELLKEMLQQQNIYSIDWHASYAYGDSVSDLPILELVGHSVVVEPEATLKEIAHSRNWEILLNKSSAYK